MDIDIYQQCPCHSGKKIKFCCGKDIVSELGQIVAKCQSNQLQSALDQIQRVIARSGERDCLLTLQTHILFTLGEVDKAAEINAKFAARHPGHPIALQHEAMNRLAQGELAAAISGLQDAVDALRSDEIPLTLSNAFQLLGTVLLSGGQIIAARAHLQFALMVRGEEGSEELQRLIHESFRVPGLPLILKADFRLEPAPTGRDWSGKYQNVIRAMNRGQFRLALRILQRIDERWPDQPEVVRSLAIVHSILADDQQMPSAWHRLATLDGIPHWLAVEAEAMSHLFLPDDPSGSLDVVAASTAVSDLDAAYQIATSLNRVALTSCPETDPFEMGPPPRYAFHLLDREKLSSASDLSSEDIPLVVGEMLFYGKQTDRVARLVFIATRNDGFTDSLAYLQEHFSDQIEPEFEEQVITTSPVAADVLSWNWHIPPELDVKDHQNLVAAYRRKILLERWTQIPFSCLDGKTPMQAVGQPDLAIALEALLLNLEQSVAIQMSGQQDMAELRKKLQLSEPEPLNAQDLKDELLTPLRLRHVDPTTWSDEQLARLFAESTRITNSSVLKRIVPEILNRPSLSDVIPRDMCYSMLAQLCEDNQQALEYLAQARQEAKLSGHNVGYYLVQEMEIRLSRGMTDKLPELLQTIQKQYLSDPEVEYQLARVLTRFGLISPDGRTVMLPRATPSGEEPQTGANAIWTPDSGESPAVATGKPGGTSSESKIWVPGSD